MKVSGDVMPGKNNFDLTKKIVQSNVKFLKENLKNLFSGRDRVIYDPVTSTSTYDIVLVVDKGKVCSVKKKALHVSELKGTEVALNGAYLIKGNKGSIVIDSKIKDQIFLSSITEFNKT